MKENYADSQLARTNWDHFSLSLWHLDCEEFIEEASVFEL